MVGGKELEVLSGAKTEGLAASFLWGKFWTFLDAQARHRLLALQIVSFIIHTLVLSISPCDYDRPGCLMQVTLRLFQ